MLIQRYEALAETILEYPSPTVAMTKFPSEPRARPRVVGLRRPFATHRETAVPGNLTGQGSALRQEQAQAITFTAPGLASVAGYREQMRTRLRMLKRLPENHDGEGAAAAVLASADSAMAFIGQICADSGWGVTLNDDGLAVIEFEDRNRGAFGDITFSGDGGNTVECYHRLRGQPSQVVRGAIEDGVISQFLSEVMGITR